MEQIKEWRSRSIYMVGVDRPGIIKEILHIRLSHLQELSIRKNRIESLENVSCLKMENIQRLYLNYNPFISLGSFRKCRYPSFTPSASTKPTHWMQRH